MKKIITILLITLLLVGCGSKQDRKTVRVGIIRVPNDTVVAIQNKWIEEALEPLGLDVEFMFFDSGVAMNQAFASGSLDIAEMGFTNSVVALSKKLPVELFWIHDVIGTTEALVVKDDSIQNIEDLKGKTIATIFSSTSHLSLLKTLEMANIKTDEVTLLSMETAEIVAAWKRGDIDAAYSWEPTLTTLKEDGRVLIDSAELAKEGLMTTNVGLVHKDFATNNRDALLAIIQSFNQAYEYKEANYENAVKDAAAYLELSETIVDTQIQGATWLSYEEMISDDYMGQRYLEVMLETSKIWSEHQFIDNILDEEAISNFVNTEYIEEVMQND